jgi:hypothetical protein
MASSPFCPKSSCARWASSPVRSTSAPPLESFARVLVNDSTVEKLPKHLAALFPGSGNQHGKDCASLKIQWVCDLKNSSVQQACLSGFTRNDPTAAWGTSGKWLARAIWSSATWVAL